MTRAARVYFRGVAVIALTASGLAGCMAARSTLDAMDDEFDFASGGQVVEAFIEYSGPNARWAGPRTYRVHLSARDPWDDAEKSEPVASLRVEPAMPAGGSRSPASVERKTPMTLEVARQQLNRLSNKLQGDDEDSPSHEFKGCLYPLRVKLVRQDGAILEKHGCRARAGWAVEVSRFTSDLIAGAAGK